MGLLYTYIFSQKGFYFWEFFYILCQFWCISLLHNKLFIQRLFVEDVAEILQMCSIVMFFGYVLGLFVAWLSDSYLGRCNCVMYGQFIALLFPIFLILVISSKGLNYPVKILLIYLTTAFAMVFLCLDGVRTSLLLDQISKFDESFDLLRQYTTLIVFQRLLAICVGHGIWKLVPQEGISNLYLNVAIFLTCFVYVICFPFIKRKLSCQQNCSIINEVVKCGFSAIKNRIHSHEARFHWLDYAGAEYNTSTIFIAKMAYQIIITWLPLFCFSIAEYVLIHITGKYKIHLFDSDEIIENIDIPLILYISKILFLTITIFGLYPLQRWCKLAPTFLQRIGMAYSIVGTGLIVIIAMEFLTLRKQGIKYVKGYGTVMIFNAMPTNLTVITRWDMTITKIPSMSFNIFHKIPAKIPKEISRATTRGVNGISNEWYISVEEMKTISYVYKDNHLRQINGTLPEYNSSNTSKSANLFLIFGSPISKESIIFFSADSWKFGMIVSTLTKEYEAFCHPFGTFKMSFYEIDTNKSEACSIQVFIKGRIQAILITEVSRGKYCAFILPIKTVSHKEMDYVFVPIFLIAFGDTTLRVSLLTIIYFQSNVEVRAVICSILYFILNANVCKFVLDFMYWDVQIPLIALTILALIYSITLFIFIYFAARYSIEEQPLVFNEALKAITNRNLKSAMIRKKYSSLLKLPQPQQSKPYKSTIIHHVPIPEPSGPNLDDTPSQVSLAKSVSGSHVSQSAQPGQESESTGARFPRLFGK